MKSFKVILVTIIFIISFGVFLVFDSYPASYWEIQPTIFQLDENLGFIRQPSQIYFRANTSNNPAIEYRINNLGLRGSDIIAKTNRPRVLLVGSSQIFGQGLAENETSSAILLMKLKERNLNFDVINAGFLAYSLDQKIKLLKTQLVDKLQPDQIFFFLSPIDFTSLRQNAFILNLYNYNEVSDSLSEVSVNESFFYRSSKVLHTLNEKLNMPRTLGVIHTFLNKINNFFVLAKIAPHETKRIRKLLEELKLFIQNKNIKITFFILPENDLEGLHQYEQLEKQFDIINLNKNRIFQENKVRLYLEDNYHLSSEANNILADYLKTYLISFN